jgi:hypothetical protein
MNRFDLEENIQAMGAVEEDLKALLYKVGDSPTSPTEDELANTIIGMIELHKIRYEKLWNCFEQLIAENERPN